MPSYDEKDIKITPVKPVVTTKQEATFYAPDGDFNKKGLLQPSPKDFYFDDKGILYVRPNDFYESVTNVEVDWNKHLIIVTNGDGSQSYQPIPEYVETKTVSTSLVTVVEFDETIGDSDSVKFNYANDNSIVKLQGAWRTSEGQAYLLIPGSRMFQQNNNYLAQPEELIKKVDNFSDTDDSTENSYQNVVTSCVKTNNGDYIIYSTEPFKGRVIFVGGYLYINNNLLNLLYTDNGEKHAHILTFWKASADKDTGKSNGIITRDVPIVTPEEVYTIFNQSNVKDINNDENGITVTYNNNLAIKNLTNAVGEYTKLDYDPTITLPIITDPSTDQTEIIKRGNKLVLRVTDNFQNRMTSLENFKKDSSEMFVSRLNNKTWILYGRNYEEHAFTLTAGAKPETVAYRSTDGSLRAADPTTNDDLVTLRYLNNKIGAANGIAPLGETGLIPAAYLPAYVDDVVIYPTKNDFPKVGRGDAIYVDATTNLTYRWGDTGWADTPSLQQYVEISKSLALGYTAETAFPGSDGMNLLMTATANATNIQKLTTRVTDIETYDTEATDKFTKLFGFTGEDGSKYVSSIDTLSQLYGTNSVGKQTSYNLADFVKSEKVDVLDNPDAKDTITLLWPSADGTIATEDYVKQRIHEAGTIPSDMLLLIDVDQPIDSVKTFHKLQKFEGEGSGIELGENTVISTSGSTLIKLETGGIQSIEHTVFTVHDVPFKVDTIHGGVLMTRENTAFKFNSNCLPDSTGETFTTETQFNWSDGSILSNTNTIVFATIMCSYNTVSINVPMFLNGEDSECSTTISITVDKDIHVMSMRLYLEGAGTLKVDFGEALFTDVYIKGYVMYLPVQDTNNTQSFPWRSN